MGEGVRCAIWSDSRRCGGSSGCGSNSGSWRLALILILRRTLIHPRICSRGITIRVICRIMIAIVVLML